jgi:chorismate--pyruvate lyase
MKSRQADAWRQKVPRRATNRPLLPWLKNRDSLTAQIQSLGKFSIRLVRQKLGRPTQDEAAPLAIQPRHLAWIREVSLHCDGQPVIFAHTVLTCHPRGPLTGWLARLGTRSLGALLFAHAGFSRGQLECRRLDHRHALFKPAIKAMQLMAAPPESLWARRSYFVFGRQKVLVTEIFSPFWAGKPSPKSGLRKFIAAPRPNSV